MSKPSESSYEDYPICCPYCGDVDCDLVNIALTGRQDYEHECPKRAAAIIGMWITMRRPTAEDADDEGGVWNSKGQWVKWDEVLTTEPWMRTNRPKPYRSIKINLPADYVAKAEGNEV